MKHVFLHDGRRVGGETSGRARHLPLVLLHGLCEDRSVWEPLLPALTGIRLVRIDLPGFGRSDVPAKPGIDGYAAAVRAALDQLEIDRCVLVGHSLGGYTALAFAEKYGDRLAGLGLFHSHPFADSEAQREKRRQGIGLLRGGKKDQFVAQLFPGLFPPGYAEKHPDLIEKLIVRGQRNPAEGIAAALEGMMERPDRTAVLRDAAVPVLLLLGEKDPFTPPEQREKMLPLPRVGDIHVLPGVAHMGMFEAPEKTGGILRDFHTFCLNA